MRILVIKFGGTSVGSIEALLRSAALVHGQVERWEGVVVVVSAMRGATNQLLTCGEIASGGGQEVDLEPHVAGFEALHRSAISAMDLNDQERKALDEMVDRQLGELRHQTEKLAASGYMVPEHMDALAALGELSCAPLFAALLRKSGLKAESVDARRFICTNDHFQNAAVQQVTTRSWTRATLLPLLVKGIIPVVTGFIGADYQNRTTTLGRGASDYTSTIVAGCLGASEVWNLTDVDGVMTADPHLVPEAQTIKALSFDEMKTLALVGARVLHPDTVLPLVEGGIPLRVMNTFNSDAPGTLIHPDMDKRSGLPLGVVCTYEGDQARISVIGDHWRAGKLRELVADQGIHVMKAEALDVCAGAAVVVSAEDGARTAKIIHTLVFRPESMPQPEKNWFFERIIEGLRFGFQRMPGRRLGNKVKVSKL